MAIAVLGVVEWMMMVVVVAVAVVEDGDHRSPLKLEVWVEVVEGAFVVVVVVHVVPRVVVGLVVPPREWCIVIFGQE